MTESMTMPEAISALASILRGDEPQQPIDIIRLHIEHHSGLFYRKELLDLCDAVQEVADTFDSGWVPMLDEESHE